MAFYKRLSPLHGVGGFENNKNLQNMAVKGKTNNPNGRPKGSKNKITKDLRLAVKSFLDSNWDDMQKSYKKLHPKDKLTFYEKLLSYALPKLQSIDANVMFADKLEQLTEAQLNILIDQILNSEHEQE